MFSVVGLFWHGNGLEEESLAQAWLPADQLVVHREEKRSKDGYDKGFQVSRST
jgi:hypothetical protein